MSIKRWNKVAKIFIFGLIFLLGPLIAIFGSPQSPIVRIVSSWLIVLALVFLIEKTNGFFAQKKTAKGWISFSLKLLLVVIAYFVLMTIFLGTS